MTKKKLYSGSIQVNLTSKDRVLLERVADERSLTASDIIRELIRSLEKTYPVINTTN
jgi:hypothetical protein